MRRNIALVCLFFVFFLNLQVGISNATTIIINSKDWRDAYLAMFYGGIIKANRVYFIENLYDANIIPKFIKKEDKVILFENKNKYIVKNYNKVLSLQGYKNLELFTFPSYSNLQKLIASKVNYRKYILIPSKYGFDALSVTPYALKKGYLPLFYNKENYKEVVNILANGCNSLLLYGHYSPFLISQVSFCNPKIMDYGSTENNFRLVEELLNEQEGKQRWVILCNGYYFEYGFLTEGLPILIYKDNLEEILNFSKRVNITNMEVIGSDMVNVGQRIRELSGRKIGVVVKFGQTYTGIPELKGKIYALKTFPIPIPILSLSIQDILFDPNLQKLFIIVKNTGTEELKFYLVQGNILYKDSILGEVSDEHLHIIIPNETFTYSFDLHNITQTNLETSLLLIYGLDEPLKNYVLNKGKSLPPYTSKVSEFIFDDISDVCLEDFYYLVGKGFVIKVKNCGEIPVYADFELIIPYRNKEQIATYPGKIFLKKGETREILIQEYLDVKNQKEVNLEIYYGKDPDILGKKLVKTLEVRIEKEITSYLTLLTFTFGIVAILLIILWRKKYLQKFIKEIKYTILCRKKSYYYS